MRLLWSAHRPGLVGEFLQVILADQVAPSDLDGIQPTFGYELIHSPPLDAEHDPSLGGAVVSMTLYLNHFQNLPIKPVPCSRSIIS